MFAIKQTLADARSRLCSARYNKKNDLHQKNQNDYLFFVFLSLIASSVINSSFKNQEAQRKKQSAQTIII